MFSYSKMSKCLNTRINVTRKMSSSRTNPRDLWASTYLIKTIQSTRRVILNMHIRHNRMANQNIGRGHNRSWFIEVDVRADFHRYFTKRSPILLSQDWIHDVSVDAKGKGHTNEYRPLNAGPLLPPRLPSVLLSYMLSML